MSSVVRASRHIDSSRDEFSVGVEQPVRLQLQNSQPIKTCLLPLGAPVARNYFKYGQGHWNVTSGPETYGLLLGTTHVLSYN